MAASIDQQFIEYIVKSVVGNPDVVKINRRIDEKGVLLELSVDPEDLGRVIGKRGATAQSLRTLLRALGTKNDARYNLKIVDTGDGSHRPPHDNRATDDTAAPAEEPPTDDAVIPDEPNDGTVVADEPDDNTEEELVPESAKKKDESDVVSRTRAELADLDDLDV